jgi:hypothetical protein
LIADKAFDSSSRRGTSAARKSSSRSIRGARCRCRSTPRSTNGGHLIENFFAKLKEFKRIAMRADKTDQASPR